MAQKNKLPAVTVQDARMGILLQAAQQRWESEFAKSVQRQGLLQTILQLIDDNQVEGVKALRGMIDDAVKDVSD